MKLRKHGYDVTWHLLGFISFTQTVEFFQTLSCVCLTSKKSKTVLCSVIMYASNESTKARTAGECFSLLLEYSWHFFACFLTEQRTVFVFYLFYNIALLTFVEKLALICKKTSFIHSLQVMRGF